MRRAVLLLLLFLVLLLAPIGARYVRYYGLGGGSAEAPPSFDPAAIPEVTTPAANDFADEPEVGSGFVLLDRAHDNEFEIDELTELDARLAARGYEMIPYSSGDLASALRPANAYIVIAPLSNFSRAQIRAVSDFVARGGRLLVVGDPTRFRSEIQENDFTITLNIDADDIALNGLANEFGIIFNGDYVYNTNESEGNYRNIILGPETIAEDELTDGLERVVFYGSHSLQTGPEARSLFTADENTYSSDTERSGGLVLAASSANGRVLAMGDVDFLNDPYHTVYDNRRLITSIADFLVSTERDYTVADFPFFFNGPVDLKYVGDPEIGPDAFDEIIALQDGLRRVNRSLSLAAEPDEAHDVFYLGLYNQAEEVEPLLDAAGISLVIDPPLEDVEAPAAEEDTSEDGTEEEEVPDGEDGETIRQVQSPLGNVGMSGTALVLLDENDDSAKLVVLAASNDGLEATVNRLLDIIPLTAENALGDCLLQGTLALCPTGVADEPLEAELDTSGVAQAEMEDDEEPAEEEAETDETGTGDEDQAPPDELEEGDFVPGIGVTIQGDISAGDTVDGTLMAEEAHGWLFRGGPAVLDISVEPFDEMDVVLQVYDADYDIVAAGDDAFAGEPELLEGVEIEDDGAYLIVVRDFFEEGGEYSLEVIEGEPAPSDEPTAVFIFADDEGEGSFTSAAAFEALLPASYDVTTWIASESGNLEPDTLQEVDLVIWTSGDYASESTDFDEDILTIFDYFLGGGNLLITGATPPFLQSEGLEAAPLVDLEVTGDDATLLEGFNVGDVIGLDRSYEAALIDETDLAQDEASATLLFLRGPESEASGTVAAVGVVDEFNSARLFLLAAPYAAFPDDAQETLLTNLLGWFRLD